MDVSSFFTRLRQQVNFHIHGADQDIETTDMGSGSSVPASAPNSGDREDDGYLLVGESRSERTTVHTATFSSHEGPDAPPTYGQVSDELPSYTSVLSGEVPIIAGPTMFSRVELSQLQSQDGLSPRGGRSAISDVPFQLHPSLTIQQSVNAMFADVDLNPQRFNWSQYSHDFMNEKLCLRDLNCDEEANIDEFVTLSHDTDMRNNLPSSNSGVNLIQL